MSERAKFWIQVAVDVLVGAPGWVALFLENEAFSKFVGDAIFNVITTCYPFVLMTLGALTGYRYCRVKMGKMVDVLNESIDVLERSGFTDERIAALLDVLPGMPREQRLVIGRAVSEGGVFISNAKTEPIARSLVKDGYLREESRESDTCASYSVPAPLAKAIVNDEKVVASLDDATTVFNESWVRRNP